MHLDAIPTTHYNYHYTEDYREARELSRITVADFLIDEENEEKFWGGGETGRSVTADQVLQVLEQPFTVVRNRKERRGQYLVIGRDSSGECLAIPIEPTHDPVVWRPVTVWRCTNAQRARLPQNR